MILRLSPTGPQPFYLSIMDASYILAKYDPLRLSFYVTWWVPQLNLACATPVMAIMTQWVLESVK